MGTVNGVSGYSCLFIGLTPAGVLYVLKFPDGDGLTPLVFPLSLLSLAFAPSLSSLPYLEFLPASPASWSMGKDQNLSLPSSTAEHCLRDHGGSSIALPAPPTTTTTTKTSSGTLANIAAMRSGPMPRPEGGGQARRLTCHACKGAKVGHWTGRGGR